MFNEYHDLNYKDKSIKIILLNIGELLTPISFAYWFIVNGAKLSCNKNLYLNTQR